MTVVSVVLYSKTHLPYLRSCPHTKAALVPKHPDAVDIEDLKDISVFLPFVVYVFVFTTICMVLSGTYVDGYPR